MSAEDAALLRTCVSTTPSPSTATGAAMSDVGFIPTTHQVREAYEVAHEEVGVPCDITGFDRWLNDIIRRAKEEAWDEALQARAGWMQDQRYYAEDEVPNPYRADRIEQGGQP